MPDIHDRIALNIRAIARSKKLALSHLADRAAISRAELFNVLGGKKSPTVRLLARIADELGVDIAELFKSAALAPPPRAKMASVARPGRPRHPAAR